MECVQRQPMTDECFMARVVPTEWGVRGSRLLTAAVILHVTAPGPSSDICCCRPLLCGGWSRLLPRFQHCHWSAHLTCVLWLHLSAGWSGALMDRLGHGNLTVGVCCFLDQAPELTKRGSVSCSCSCWCCALIEMPRYLPINHRIQHQRK